MPMVKSIASGASALYGLRAMASTRFWESRWTLTASPVVSKE